jgi:hypothetical protein
MFVWLVCSSETAYVLGVLTQISYIPSFKLFNLDLIMTKHGECVYSLSEYLKFKQYMICFSLFNISNTMECPFAFSPLCAHVGPTHLGPQSCVKLIKNR